MIKSSYNSLNSSNVNATAEKIQDAVSLDSVMVLDDKRIHRQWTSEGLTPMVGLKWWGQTSTTASPLRSNLYCLSGEKRFFSPPATAM